MVYICIYICEYMTVTSEICFVHSSFLPSLLELRQHKPVDIHIYIHIYIYIYMYIYIFIGI